MAKKILKRFFFYLPLMVLLASCNKNCLEAYTKKSDGEINIAKRISEGELDNGVKYFYLKNANPKGRCYLRLNVAVGSFYESENELGISHLLEHLAFVSNDKTILGDETLDEWFQRNGMAIGPDANAFTTSEHTTYQIDLPKCDEEHVKDALRIFRMYADGLKFNDDAIAKEKKIIDAEHREYQNTRDKLSERLIDKLYAGTSHVSRPVFGNSDVRSKITRDQLIAFYEKWYQPKNLTVVLVGDYGDLIPADMIKNAFSSMTAKTDLPSPIPSSDPSHQYKSFVLNEPEISYVEVVFSVQAKKIRPPHFSRELIKDRLAFDLAITLLSNIYQSEGKTRTDNVRAPVVNGSVVDKGVYEFTLSVASAKDQWEKEFMNAYAVIKRAATYGFDEDDFLSAKKTLSDSIDQWVVEEETHASTAWLNKIIAHIQKRDFANDAQDYRKWSSSIIASLTAKDCQNILKNVLKSGNHYIFALGTIDDNEANVKQLSSVLDKAKSQKVSAPKHEPRIPFQYQIKDCDNAQKLDLEHIENIDTYKLKLANNIDVLLKPTKFKNDEIILHIMTDEGYATMNARDFDVARLAAAVLADGGLKKHPPEQMPNLLKDKFFQGSFSVFDDRIQLNVATRSKDVRFALEYVRAYIVDPLYSETTLNRLKENIKIDFRDLEHNIWAPLQHEFVRDLTNNDHRVGRPTLDDLLKMTREDLLSWHQKFVSGRKLNIVVVGDFNKDSLVKDLACVFGTLPKTETTAKKKAPELRFKSGVDKIYEVKTKDETSKIVLRYPLNFRTKEARDHRLPIVRNIISETLRLKLREKRQVIYTPHVMVVENIVPTTQNWLDIVLSIPKKKAQKTLVKSKDILAKLAQKGVTEKDLVKAKEPYLAERITLAMENSWWADVISANFSHAKNLSWITKSTDDIAKISVKDVNEVLRKYLVKTNASSAIVNAIGGE